MLVGRLGLAPRAPAVGTRGGTQDPLALCRKSWTLNARTAADFSPASHGEGYGLVCWLFWISCLLWLVIHDAHTKVHGIFAAAWRNQ